LTRFSPLNSLWKNVNTFPLAETAELAQQEISPELESLQGGQEEMEKRQEGERTTAFHSNYL